MRYQSQDVGIRGAQRRGLWHVSADPIRLTQGQAVAHLAGYALLVAPASRAQVFQLLCGVGVVVCQARELLRRAFQDLWGMACQLVTVIPRVNPLAVSYLHGPGEFGRFSCRPGHPSGRMLHRGCGGSCGGSCGGGLCWCRL